MEYRVKLKLETPLLAGGRKLGNNYMKSMDYLAGSVVRAALARAILNPCPYYDAKGDRRYWVDYQDGDECKKCSFKNICMDFSNIKIDTFYPLGAKPYPESNMRCKYNSHHPNVDTLIYRINRHIGREKAYNGLCPQCGERLERHRGLGKDGRDVEGIYQLVGKTGLSLYTRSARTGILYSIDALLEEIFVDDERRDTEFIGKIRSHGDIGQDLNNIKSLRLGGYTSSGFGKSSLHAEKSKDKEGEKALRKRVEEFNSHIEDEENYYISLGLISDAYLGLEEAFEEEGPPSSIDKEEFINRYEEALRDYIGKDLKLEFTLVNNEWRRGFDTSGKDSRYREAKIISKAASLLVLSIPRERIDYKKLLQIQRDGIGNNREHGFGQVEVCAREHVVNRMKANEEV